MKALILAAGTGKRVRSAQNIINKCLYEVSGMPLIEHALRTAAILDELDEIILVVGYQAESIINRYGTSYLGKKITYRIQSRPKGVLDALNVASSDLEGDDFMLFFGNETVFSGRHQEMIDMFLKENADAVCGLVRPIDPTRVVRTYAVILDAHGVISRLIERPVKILNEWQGTGYCVLKNSVLKHISRVPVHPVAGEQTLPDLLQNVVDQGGLVRGFHLADDYLSILTRDDLEMLADIEIGHETGPERSLLYRQ
ncbi:sugar phosphate nucleotidyltransferase [Desulfonatronum thioautotrophicum]|uniref:sugar phosphate nucleotidyltransferase n=1 Tax=Desulfonatronum thioautotrophicum TaxID=617001 RepID=UPI0005EBE34B|nr:sugar phosphate nucleotidyltransferase [Desulfonatronum thioautotrophicum]